jgi:hypothetical protein
MEDHPILNEIDVVRALKDESYRAGLNSEAQQALETLMGEGEFSEQDLENVSGGFIMKDSIIIRTGVIAKPLPQSDSLQ